MPILWFVNNNNDNNDISGNNGEGDSNIDNNSIKIVESDRPVTSTVWVRKVKEFFEMVFKTIVS